MGNFEGYQLHKIVWKIFSDSPNRKRDFLYRYETVNGWPTFYTVSERAPENVGELWDINTKPYEPQLMAGDRLAFKLRANPVRLTKKERTADEVGAWCKNREERGLVAKEPTKKRLRHDVVMEAKNKIGFKDLPPDKRPHLATLIQEAGMAWLKEKSNENGFFIDDDSAHPSVRADGYCQHRLYKGKGRKFIEFSTLEFNGTLTITDPGKFTDECLFTGIGPAKGFGCGLMLVKRV